jgi:hypothetical protein
MSGLHLVDPACHVHHTSDCSHDDVTVVVSAAYVTGSSPATRRYSAFEVFTATSLLMTLLHAFGNFLHEFTEIGNVGLEEECGL